MRGLGRCRSIKEGSSMKSVFRSVTDRIRRPSTVNRNPRATVSTSGSSGMKSVHENITTLWPFSTRPQTLTKSRRYLVLVIIRIRRMLRDDYWILFQSFQGDLHRSFELRVVSSGDGRRLIFHFDVGRDTVVLYFPFAVQSVARGAWRGNKAAIQERGIIGNTHEPSPGARAD